MHMTFDIEILGGVKFILRYCTNAVYHVMISTIHFLDKEGTRSRIHTTKQMP